MKLEINSSFIKANDIFQSPDGKQILAVTPPLDENYWIMRVPLSKKQAIVCFPKFFTIGIGFQVEEDDWNSNLPWQRDAEYIFNHIKSNKGDKSISDKDCIEAIKMLQSAIKDYQGKKHD